MKTLILLLIIYIGVYQEVSCGDRDREVTEPRLKRPKSNKKLFIPKHRRVIDIFHGKKPFKKFVDSVYNTKKPRKVRLAGDKDKYKRFPAFGLEYLSSDEMKRLSIPDSPYFPLEANVDAKNRLRKSMVDNYAGTIIRNKRSSHVNMKKKNRFEKENNRKHKHKGKNVQKKRKVSKIKKKPFYAAIKHPSRKPKKGSHISRRVTGGRDAKIEDYPYIASIQKDDEHWCSGAILNPRLVITTANCLWKARRSSRMLVRAGSRFTNRGGQLAKIQEVVRNPLWNLRSKPDHDLALVLLDRDLRFSDTLHAVDLPNRVMSPAFDDAWVVSYGAERRDGVFEPRWNSLQVYHSRVMDHDVCNNITRRFGVTVSDNFMCLNQTSKRGPCTRDTGAPAVSDGVVWGLASWSLRKLCGSPRYPAMFSYTASNANMDFILNATTKLMSDQRYSPFYEPYVAPIEVMEKRPVQNEY